MNDWGLRVCLDEPKKDKKSEEDESFPDLTEAQKKIIEKGERDVYERIQGVEYEYDTEDFDSEWTTSEDKEFRELKKQMYFLQSWNSSMYQMEYK